MAIYTDMSAVCLRLSLAACALWVGVGAQLAHAQITDEQRIHVAQRLKEATVTVIAGESSGSGFLVSARGWIVTNAHVASGARWSGRLRVRFSDGEARPATLIAYDAHHDLAVAEVEGPHGVRPLSLGDSDEVKVGQTVLAFGSPFGLEGTLTQGIVSARRDLAAIGSGDVRGVIQTDAPINPGNSGGPLVNTKGEVIGINTAILSRTGGSNGIGFAVPTAYVRELLGAIERELGNRRDAAGSARAPGPTHTDEPKRAGPSKVWLGLYGDDFRARGYSGVRVQRVMPESPAARAGLLSASDPAPPFIEQLGIPWTGHIILALDSHPVRNMGELKKLLARHQPGEQALVTVTVGPGIVTGETVVELEAQPSASRAGPGARRP
jgi:S1-C subfamily serine protease